MATTYASSLLLVLFLYILTEIIQTFVQNPAALPPAVALPYNETGKILPENDYAKIARLLAESILETGRTEEIEFNGLFFPFHGNISYQNHTRYTGVEFMGDRESYTETEYHLDVLDCFGIFNEEGNRLRQLSATEISVIRQLTNQNLNNN